MILFHIKKKHKQNILSFLQFAEQYLGFTRAANKGGKRGGPNNNLVHPILEDIITKLYFETILAMVYKKNLQK